MNRTSSDELHKRLKDIVERSSRASAEPPLRSARGQDRDPLLNTSISQAHREDQARHIVISALQLIREAIGPDVLRSAYGVTTTTRSDGLRSLAGRLHLASYLFLDVEDQDKFNLAAVGKEALAIAFGDKPNLFDQLSSKKVPWRLMHARFSALRWDAVLQGKGLSEVDSHKAITSHAAFGQSWDTIRKWRGMAEDRWGKARVEQRLASDRSIGAQHRRHVGLMKLNEDWRTALDRAGANFKNIQRLA